MKWLTRSTALVFLLAGPWWAADAAGEGPAVAEPAADDPAATAASPQVVYLEKSRGWGLMPADKIHRGMLARELFRQALLIAARDELGLATRDAWLGDAMPDGGDDVPLDIGTAVGGWTRIEYLRGFYPAQEVVDHGSYRSPGPLDYLALAVDREKASRGALVTLLKKAGFEGAPNVRKPDAAVSEDVQRLLGEMTFTSQFDAVRRLHAMIRADGESPARLGALARGYANLGMLTEVYWHPAHKVFKARAMLYVQRMVAASPKPTALALRHRAYVLALVGLHKPAMADLATAKQTSNEQADTEQADHPDWTPLVWAFCHYDCEKLDPASVGQRDRQLARLLRYVAVEQSGYQLHCDQRHIVQAGMEAAKALPECYRVLDSLAEWAGVGLGHSSTVAPMSTMGRQLYGRVAAMPGLPETAKEICDEQRADGSLLGALFGRTRKTNPTEEFQARGRLMRALIAAGSPTTDRGEPSWASLGVVVREASFLQVHRRAWFERVSLSVSPDDFLEATAPLVADHPYRVSLECLVWDFQKSREAMRKLGRLPLEGVETHGERLCDILGDEDEKAWQGQVLFLWDRADGVVRDLTIRLWRGWDEILVETGHRLEAVSPYSPAARAALIERDWKNVAAKAAQWEKESSHHAGVLVALGNRYAALHRADDAIRCLEAAIEVTPDAATYTALAEIYKKQGDEAKYVATLEKYLAQPEYDLSQASIRADIAVHYMQRHQFDKALPYAEQTASTYSCWGLICAGKCHEGLGHLDTAEQYFQAASQRYRDSAILWYLFCRRTGHGDLDAARELAKQVIEDNETRGRPNRDGHASTFYYLEGRYEQALKLLEVRLAASGDPTAGLEVALLADRLKHVQKRDAALQEVAKRGSDYVSTLTEKHRLELVGLAAMLAKDLAAGGKAQIDMDAANRLCAKAPRNDQQFFLLYLGRYLDLHGNPKQADECWKKCLAYMREANLLAKTLAGAELVAHGHKIEAVYKEIFAEEVPLEQGDQTPDKTD